MLDRFIHEISTPKYGEHSTGKIKVEDKNSLRKAGRLGRSPNLADAFCLTFAKGIPTRNKQSLVPAEMPAPAYVW